ncbi:hypothetical protein VD0002_g7560 [Verticillium dahliae]|nr:hypothetical protein VD0003_g8449 [Verticillium dahliae]PNH60033.1 hypothetical protein VD0002_g7560 [Verticillium dahliae]
MQPGPGILVSSLQYAARPQAETENEKQGSERVSRCAING